MAFVGAQHEFHDTQFVREWADRFIPSPERIQLFDTIIDSIVKHALTSAHIVELGIGPAYLAERVLGTLSHVTYEGVDFSEPMLEIAAERLAPYGSRVTFTQADLVAEDWGVKVTHPVGAIVSTWALHDLGGETNTAKVYRDCCNLLPPGGVFLNGDFVKPDHTPHEYEAGRFLVSRHLDILQEAGFNDAQCLIYLENEIENPTAAQNYACLQAVV
jgi:SAM-dependent methyltransferase